MSIIGWILDGSPDITSSVNDMELDELFPCEPRELAKRYIEQRKDRDEIAAGWIASAKRNVELENRIKVIVLAMNPAIDVPETVTKQSFADFWRLRCKNIRAIAKVTASGDVE